jgi:hypothetical protein
MFGLRRRSGRVDVPSHQSRLDLKVSYLAERHGPETSKSVRECLA